MSTLHLEPAVRIDRRTHHTQLKLQAALSQLQAAGQPFATLTVSQLCAVAGVGRATFYRHHQDIADVLTVAYLMALQTARTQLNALPNVTYVALAQTAVTSMLAHPELPQLVTWAGAEDRIIPVLTGLVQQVLTALAAVPQRRRFVATYLGTSLYQFSRQLAAERPALDRRQAFQLFVQLVPNVLQAPQVPTS